MINYIISVRLAVIWLEFVNNIFSYCNYWSTIVLWLEVVEVTLYFLFLTYYNHLSSQLIELFHLPDIFWNFCDLCLVIFVVQYIIYSTSIQSKFTHCFPQKEKVRPDGRALLEMRPITVSVGEIL